MTGPAVLRFCVIFLLGCCGQAIGAKESEGQKQYLAYSNWTECSVTCGGGLSFRTRECEKLSGESDCEKAEERPCNVQPCDSFESVEPASLEEFVNENTSEPDEGNMDDNNTDIGSFPFGPPTVIDEEGNVDPSFSKTGFFENIMEGQVEGRDIPSREEFIPDTSTTDYMSLTNTSLPTRATMSTTARTKVTVTTTQKKPAKTIAAEACKVEVKTSADAKELIPKDFNRVEKYSCEWIIKSDDGKRIMARVTYNNRKSCCDEFEIYDGQTRLDKVTGAGSFQKTYVTRSDRLIITFRSPGAEGFRNFAVLHAQYTAPDTTQQPSTTTTKVETVPPQPMGECGYKLKATKEVKKFDSNVFVKNTKYDCVWTISAPKGSLVKIRVRYYNTADCCSALELYDEARIFKKYRGTIYVGSDDFTTRTNTLLVLYRNPSVNGYSRIKILYRAIKPKEVEPVKDASTTVTPTTIRTTKPLRRAAKKSQAPIKARRCQYRVMATHYVRRWKAPLFIRGEHFNCTWYIMAHGGQRVQVRLYYYNTAAGGDLMEIRDGSEVIDQIYANTYSQTKYTTKGSTLSLQFTSEGHPGVRRFYIYYQAVPDAKPEPHAHWRPVPYRHTSRSG